MCQATTSSDFGSWEAPTSGGFGSWQPQQALTFDLTSSSKPWFWVAINPYQ